MVPETLDAYGFPDIEDFRRRRAWNASGISAHDRLRSCTRQRDRTGAQVAEQCGSSGVLQSDLRRLPFADDVHVRQAGCGGTFHLKREVSARMVGFALEPWKTFLQNSMQAATVTGGCQRGDSFQQRS